VAKLERLDLASVDVDDWLRSMKVAQAAQSWKGEVFGLSVG
jgi:hypothetical protein